MSSPFGVTSLRQAVLAVSVLDDIDLRPGDDGVIVEGTGASAALGGPGAHRLSWRTIDDIIGDHDPGSRTGRGRLGRTLRLHAWALAQGAMAAERIRGAARLMAMAPDADFHPGPAWAVDRVLGGALDCGIGLSLDADGELPAPLPPSLAEAVGVRPTELLPQAREHAEAMGQLAVSRLLRDTRGRPSALVSATDSQSVLRPVGGLDVVSLLGSPSVRAFLAASDGSGMRAIAVPNRRRGWYDLARIDPAFVQAAWSASEEWERGLPRPMLVTQDEVALGPGHGDAVRLALADGVVERPGIRPRTRFS